MTRLFGLLAVLLLAGPAAAQPPPEGEESPVTPAQFTEPVPAPAAGSVSAPGLPPQPPTPVVQVIVLAPRDSQDGKDVEYTVRVVNRSGVRANAVRVRVPWPDGAASLKQAEPKPQQAGMNKDLVWDIGTLDANSTQTITFSLTPAQNKAELKVRAYVRFEHGQEVVTKLSVPKLLVKADAPKQAAAENPVPVRLTVSNTGRVPAADAKLTVTISKGFEFSKEDGGDPGPVPEQRVWDLGTLPPGNVRPVALRIKPKDGRDLTVLAVVNSSNVAADRAEAKVKVVESALKLTLDGDPKAAGGATAKYTATVKNTGGAPLTNVRVTASFPDDCRPTKKADNGGRWSPSRIEWVIPRLDKDEERYLDWHLECTGSGARTVKATAAAGALEEKQSVTTLFEGAPDLRWESKFDRPTLAVDQQGMLTVTVRNAGKEPARGVRLTVDLPAEVAGVQYTPDPKVDGRRVTFPPDTVPADGQKVYTITFKADTVGPAYFKLELAGDGVGGRPLTASKAVEVTGRR